jgi:hypothetical protein
MANRGFQVTAKANSPKLTHLFGVLVCGVAVAGGACAKATVNTEAPKLDAAPDHAPEGDAKTANGKDGGTNSDVSYGPCDPFTNDGCGSDQKCAALQSGGSLKLGCGDKGDKNEVDTCTQKVEGGVQVGDDCGDGLSCFGAPAICHRLCSDHNRCPDEEICDLETGIPGIRVCRPVKKCTALKQEGCDGNEACYFTSSSEYTGPRCLAQGTAKPGSSCRNANECEPGSTCLIIGSSGICASFCSTATDGTPKCTGADTGGDICEPMAGGESEPDLGVCRQLS